MQEATLCIYTEEHGGRLKTRAEWVERVKGRDPVVKPQKKPVLEWPFMWIAEGLCLEPPITTG